MSFLNRISAWWTFKKGSGHIGPRTYIVDAATLTADDKGTSQAAPGDQIQLLKNLSRFAEKENISITVAFESEPLRKVGNGDDFGPLKVYFAGTAKAFPALIAKLQKEAQRRTQVMVITSDERLEERCRSTGAVVMRGSTFRKALESVIGKQQGRQGSGGDGRRRSRRSSNNRRSSGGGDNTRKTAPEQSKKPSEANSVHDLIDLVD